jgi:cytochrome bd-type quinol oxidase subunit 2
MIQTIKNFIKPILIASFLLVPVLVPATAGAQIQNGLCDGVNLQAGSGATCDDVADASGKVNGLITLIINIFSLVVGVVSVIMIIIGGLKYITSSGDSNNITSAKNTILYAIIGLVVVALAQFIVKFVLAKALTAGA